MRYADRHGLAEHDDLASARGVALGTCLALGARLILLMAIKLL